MITAVWRGKYVTRNTSHFKKVDPSITGAESSEEEEGEDEDFTDPPGNANADANADPPPD